MVEDETLFTVSELGSVPLVSNYNDAVLEIALGLSIDRTLIQRSGYYLLDLLSDIGGLYSILFGVLASLLQMCNYKKLDSFLASRLYLLPSDSGH